MKLIKIILTPILSLFHYIAFGAVLGIFHIIQWIANNIGGYKWHKKSVDALNYWVIQTLKITGIWVKFNNPHVLPTDRPLIFVSNHQSLFDISPLQYFLRAHHPKFVSKKELGKGIPSISYNLRHGGSVLIDRKDSKQALTAIKGFAQYLEKNNYSALIFPEGTRSRDGRPKYFSRNGLKILMKYAPSAWIVPISINNSWKVHADGLFKMPIGITITFDIHRPIPNEKGKFDEIFDRVEKSVKEGIVV